MMGSGINWGGCCGSLPPTAEPGPGGMGAKAGGSQWAWRDGRGSGPVGTDGPTGVIFFGNNCIRK